MAQVKIFGSAEVLPPRREKMSAVIHQCVMEVLGMPAGKRAHRFIYFDEGDILRPEGRTENYTIIEILMMAGRTVSTRKLLIRRLFEEFEKQLAIAPMDVEICLQESEPCNWGFRGFHGDEVKLDYAIHV